jgi:hypothetical protein
MNLWITKLPGKCTRFTASQAEGRIMRDAMIEDYGCKKKEVSIEPIDVPTKKPELIEFLNEAYATIDAAGAE